MNYWLLTTEYPPFYGGGIGTYCQFAAQMLSAAGHAVTVFVPDESIQDYVLEQERPGITLVRFHPERGGLHAVLGKTARLSHAFADMVRVVTGLRGKPDFIEAQDYLGIAYYLTQFKHIGYDWLADVPILITLHSPAFVYLEYNRVPTYRFPDFWTCEMEKQALAAADALISPSRFLAGEVRRFVDLGDKPIHIVPYAYPVEEPGPPDRIERNRIIFYGKLSPQKGSFELLSYFKTLWDRGFEHPLHIVGGTDIVYHPEMKTMGQLISTRYKSYEDKGLLQFHGKIRPDQMRAYLGNAHVIVVPSIVENFPFVVMETMSMGKVVLASVQGGQRELIEDGVSGFLFDHEDPTSFARQLEKVLALDEAALARIGQTAARSIRERYSFEVIGRQKTDLLATLQPLPPDRFPFLYQEPTIALQGVGEGNLLSVVIPYYNMGPFIGECLQSVLASTYTDLEVLIVNDGSTDEESLRALDIADDRVRVIHQENKGLALTRNEGASQARGTYLAFLDADDKVDPTYYKKAIRTLQKNKNVYFVGAWVQYFGQSDGVWPTFTPQPPYVLIHNPVNSSGLVYKRAAFLTGGLNDKRLDFGLEDYESVVNLLRQGLNGVVLPEILFHYRVRGGSMFRGFTQGKFLYSHKYIVDKHAGYYATFAAPVIHILNANGPGFLYDNPTFEVTVTVRGGSRNKYVMKMITFIKRHERLKRIALAIKKMYS